MSDLQTEQSVSAGPPQMTVLPHTLRMAPMPSPKQIVPFYDPDEFEEFVKEWVPALERKYLLVERHGGSGDHGIDVAGYLSPQRLEGEWHNYQCKRYSSALTWSTAAQEMRKMFIAAAAGHFTIPIRYVFVAPRIARSLPRQLAKPTDSRDKFLQELATTKDKIVADLTDEQRDVIKDLAARTDFSIFECILNEMLELHSTTPHWASRFPYAPLDRGPQELVPPQKHGETETRYVQQLVDVYQERYPDAIGNLDEVSGVPEADAHLKRQREAFYAAEALRVFACDSTMPIYFERLMQDVYDIVIEVAEQNYPDGWERHGAVTVAAGSVQLTPTILTPFIQPKARKGVCHHLANENRLTWCKRGKESSLNSSVEVGVRALVLLAESHPEPLDLAQLVMLDYVQLHSGEFDGPPSLHPDLPARAGEIGMKRTVLEQALLVLIRAGLAGVDGRTGGLMYTATDRGPVFVDVLEAPYVESLRERARWAVRDYLPRMNARIGTQEIINRSSVDLLSGMRP